MKVTLRENESQEELIRRFKKQTNKEGIIQEYKRKQFFYKKSLKRELKSKEARRKEKRR